MTAKTRAEQLAEKAAKLRAKQVDEQATGHASSTTTPAPLAKPVRSTLDLSPARHRAFQQWLNESAVQLGRSRLTKQQVLDALVGRLLTDETLSRLILADLRETE